MAVRPTEGWRGGPADLFTPALISRTDDVLLAFEVELTTMPATTDDAVFRTIERVVVALNELDEEHGAFATVEREDLCTFIESTLAEAGVDIDGLARRRGIGVHEITDEWRDW